MRSAAANTIFFMGFPCFKYLDVRRLGHPAIRPTIGWPEYAFPNPPAARRQAGTRCNRHFDAGLVSMLTTWTRRLIGSIGAFESFGFALPIPPLRESVPPLQHFSVRYPLIVS